MEKQSVEVAISPIEAEYYFNGHFKKTFYNV